jgi:hypothetical protein
MTVQINAANFEKEVLNIVGINYETTYMKSLNLN